MNGEHWLVTQAISNTRVRIWRVCLIPHDINHMDRHKHGQHFVVKCGGIAWCETNIVVRSMQKWRFIYIQIPNFTSRHVLRATIITLCFVVADDLHMNIHKFVAGHRTVVQPASIKIVFGCKQAQQHSRAHHLFLLSELSNWSAQNAESHWSHVHISLTGEHFSFHAFHKKSGLQCDLMSCSSRLTCQNYQENAQHF